MKNTFLLFLFLLSFTRLSAQLELKVSPSPLLFSVGAVSAEYGIAENWGIDSDVYVAEDFFGVNLSAKYYLDPRRGFDRFHVGAFAGSFGESFGVGFLFGTKIVSAKGILFEIGVGLGRSFDDGVTGYGKLHLGYRFGKQKESRRE